MDEFKNELVHGIYKSRYIASWINEGGNLGHSKENGYVAFIKWLRSLIIDGTPLTEEEINKILYYAGNGKLELQKSADKFMRGLK